VALGDAGGVERRAHRGTQILGNVGEIQAQERGVGPCSLRAAWVPPSCSS
jgi:hypothetical protein